MNGGAVTGEEGVEEGAEVTPLWCASVGWMRMRVDDVRPPVLTFCGLLLRKSSIQVHSELPKPRLLSLRISLGDNRVEC